MWVWVWFQWVDCERYCKTAWCLWLEEVGSLPPMWGRRRWRWALDTAYWLRAVCFVSALIENESLEQVAMEMMPSHVERAESRSGIAVTTTHANASFPPPTSRSRSSATAQVPLLGLFVLVDLGSPKLCKMKNKETEVGRKLASHI